MLRRIMNTWSVDSRFVITHNPERHVVKYKLNYLASTKPVFLPSDHGTSTSTLAFFGMLSYEIDGVRDNFHT